MPTIPRRAAMSQLGHFDKSSNDDGVAATSTAGSLASRPHHNQTGSVLHQSIVSDANAFGKQNSEMPPIQMSATTTTDAFRSSKPGPSRRKLETYAENFPMSQKDKRWINDTRAKIHTRGAKSKDMNQFKKLILRFVNTTDGYDDKGRQTDAKMMKRGTANDFYKQQHRPFNQPDRHLIDLAASERVKIPNIQQPTRGENESRRVKGQGSRNPNLSSKHDFDQSSQFTQAYGDY